MRISPIVRERAVKALEQRYQSKVQLKSLTVSLFPRVTLIGEELEMRKLDRPNDSPMVAIRRFVGHTGFFALLGKPIHVRYLQLEGLRLQLPHKKSADEKSSTPTSASAPKGSAELIVDEVDADGAFLRILPKGADKYPLDFDISNLKLYSAGKDQPMRFNAALTNPKPPGLIQSTGHFGPFNSDEPGDSAVDGHYTFTNADLGVFNGISGTLSSIGDYQGRLNRIEVKGRTDTPNFTVSTGAHPVDLKTEFQATVDGTDGDTYLHPVDARFLGTALVCQGKVEHKPGEPGKTIALDITMEKGRIEDLLRLAVRGGPLMNGSAQLKTKFLLPPGKGEVMSRLQLDGEFSVAQATFNRNQFQEKMTDLSLRAQGRPAEAQEKNVGPGAPTPEQIASDFHARFGLKAGTMTFNELYFQVPGAQLALAGSYGLTDEKLDFSGRFRMQAKVSQAFTGWKSMLLKAADPFFSKHGGGADIPLKISGTRSNPLFGLEFFHRNP